MVAMTDTTTTRPTQPSTTDTPTTEAAAPSVHCDLTAGCWFCDDDVREAPPAGGWLWDDGTWRAGHMPAGYSIAGGVMLESVRHVDDQSQMNEHEQATLVGVTGALIAAMRAGLGCDRVYQWATMTGYPHFHLWLLPWWSDSAVRGPAYLVASTTHEATCSPADALAAADRIRSALTG